MMNVPFKSFQQLVNDQVVATQAASNEPIDFNVGTVELAAIEANSGMGMFLQFLFSIILSYARAQTSEGAALDSWMAQFQLIRLAAVAATGNVTFSRQLTTGTVLIPAITTKVKTTDFSLQFTVIADATNPDFNPGLNSYVMLNGVSSINAKVRCDTPGAIGNVGANVITFMATPVGGVNTVNNSNPFTNGKNAESDAAFRARFVLYFNSLSRAVLIAYAYVIASIPEITRYNVVENETFSGDDQPGYVYVVIDDGTGVPPPELLDRAYQAIQTIRGLAILNDVFAPAVTNANIVVDLSISPLTTEATIEELVTNALYEYINKLPFNSTLYYSKLYEIIYDASPYILNATNLTLNGGTADIAGAVNQIFLVGTITIGFI